MLPFGPTKINVQSLSNISPEFRHELPIRGMLFSVGNRYTTGRRFVVDVDRGILRFHHLEGQHESNTIAPKSGKKQKLSGAQLDELIQRTNVFWATDPQFKEPRRAEPDQGVTLVLVDADGAKQFDSHDATDELHALYAMLWQWAAS